MERLLYTVPESMAALGGMSRSKFYALISEGHIRVVKIGRRSYVTEPELRRYVDSLAGEPVA